MKNQHVRDLESKVKKVAKTDIDKELLQLIMKNMKIHLEGD